MASSPYLSQDLKKYIQDNKIEEVLKDAVNQILAAKPNDPFTSFSQFFGKLSTPVVTLISVQGVEIYNAELKSTIQIEFTINFKDQVYKYNLPLYFTQQFAEQEILQQIFQDIISDDEHKGMKQAIQAISKISVLINSKLAKDQKMIDETLNKYLLENRNHINLVQQISFGLLHINSYYLNQPLRNLLLQNFGAQESHQPKLFINLFQGSKVVASKCKPYKILLIADTVQKVIAVSQNLRKIIVSGKKGEAGLVFYQDGTIICPADTLIDNIKMIEQAIEAAQLKDQVTLGINWLAELFYVPEEKKYDLDNPKKLLDADQMIDYYFKLCNDKQIIQYMEDPLHFNDIVGWNKLLTKFKDSKVKIGSRRVYSTLEKAKKNCETYSQQSHSDLTEQQITQLNNERVHLDYILKSPYEFATFSDFTNYVNYITSKKPQSSIIISDGLVDSEDTYFVDLAVNISLRFSFKYRMHQLIWLFLQNLKKLSNTTNSQDNDLIYIIQKQMAKNQKELLLENNQMLYNQNDQITNIIQTLESTNETAALVQVKLKQQDEKIVVIADTNQDIRRENRRVDKQTNEIVRREFYMKLILYLIVVLLLIANILVIILKLK